MVEIIYKYMYYGENTQFTPEKEGYIYPSFSGVPQLYSKV